MGIARTVLSAFIKEGERRPFSGRIMTLGRMTVAVDLGDLTRLLKRPVTRTLDDQEVFRTLGFDEVHSIDTHVYEGATHIHDLNLPVPADLRGRYDVVLDSGTLEHVFNFPMALRNIIDMAKIGGRIIILTPSSNHMDHGFYMFSPTLFADYFAANNLKVEILQVIRRKNTKQSAAWDVYEYEKNRRSFTIGCLDDRPYMIYAIVTKTEQSTSDHIPQQSAFQDAWARGALRTEPSQLYRTVEKLIGWIPGAMPLAVAARAKQTRGLRSLRYLGDNPGR